MLPLLTSSQNILFRGLEVIDYIRTGIWCIKSKRNNTKSAFLEKSKDFKSLDSINCEGLSFLVTGGSSGIGKAVATYLAQKPKTIVHILCKNTARGNAALAQIRKVQHLASKVILHIVDLGEPSQVINFTKDFIASETPLHVLINNAGVLLKERSYNSMGIELSFAINVVGTLLLTQKMIEYFELFQEDSIKRRIIYVSTSSVITQSLNVIDPMMMKQNYDGCVFYTQQKKQMLAIMGILAENHTSIFFASMHPGWVNTPGATAAHVEFYRDNKANVRTPEQGADTIIWLAISDEPLQNLSGEFYLDREITSKYILCVGETARKIGAKVVFRQIQKFICENVEGILCKDQSTATPAENVSDTSIPLTQQQQPEDTKQVDLNQPLTQDSTSESISAPTLNQSTPPKEETCCSVNKSVQEQKSASD